MFPWIEIFMESMKFHGYHEISWVNIKLVDAMKPRGIHGISMDPMKISWGPWKFHGFHEIFMESMKISWVPWNFHGPHGIFMGSMEILWIPQGFMASMNFIQTHEISWEPWNLIGAMKFYGLHENFDIWRHLNYIA